MNNIKVTKNVNRKIEPQILIIYSLKSSFRLFRVRICKVLSERSLNLVSNREDFIPGKQVSPLIYQCTKLNITIKLLWKRII